MTDDDGLIPEPLDVERIEADQSRMTRICIAMIKTFDAHIELRKADRVIVFVENEEQGGIITNGYNDDYEAMVALLIHLRSLFRANGQDLQMVAIPGDASELFADGST